MDLIANTNLYMLGPEAVVLITILAGVFHLSFSKTREERENTWYLALFGTALTLLSLAFFWFKGVGPDGVWVTRDVFSSLALHSNTNNMTVLFTADLFSMIIRTLLVIGTLLVLLFTRTYVDKRAEVPGEFYVILLSALFGGMLLSGSTDLIMVFVSLETLGISSYVLAAYLRGNVRSLEAGLKYLLYGGMATAILLFGFSILYGLTGTTSYAGMVAALSMNPMSSPLLLSIMTVMILGGICFKLSAAPFHMWAPDVYEGAPTPVIAFLSVVSKIAGFSLAIRLFAAGLPTSMPAWAGLFSVLAVLSMVIGNVVALTQSNIKRLLAYSTVAHVGYLFLGLVVLTPEGLGSLLYYLIAYLFMNLGAFAVVTRFEDVTGHTDIASYSGLVRKKPALALLLNIMFLSLAGIPITAGFFGKFFLFQAVATAGTQYLWLVGLALLTSTISLYYYLNVIRLMLIGEPSQAVEEWPVSDSGAARIPVNVALAICFLGTLLLGVFAESSLNLSLQAVSSLGLQSRDAFSLQALPKQHKLSVRPSAVIVAHSPERPL
jgi:NAD(P)H-quinone oxidoreductase subunit 2